MRASESLFLSGLNRVLLVKLEKFRRVTPYSPHPAGLDQ